MDHENRHFCYGRAAVVPGKDRATEAYRGTNWNFWRKGGLIDDKVDVVPIFN